jgi:hypothetical protein
VVLLFVTVNIFSQENGVAEGNILVYGSIRLPDNLKQIIMNLKKGNYMILR